MAERTVEIRVNVDDAEAIRRIDALSLRLDKLKAKLNDISNKVISPKIDLSGITAANAQLDKLNAKLTATGARTVSPTIKPKFDENAWRLRMNDTFLRGQLGAMSTIGSTNRASDRANVLGQDLQKFMLAGSQGGGGRFSGFISWIKSFGAAGAGAGAGGAGGGGPITGLGILAGLAAASPLFPLIPFLLGGAIGGGGSLLAGRMGVTGLSTIRADRLALRQAQVALQGAGNNTPQNRLTLRQAQSQLAADQAKYGAFLPFGKQLNTLGSSAYGALITAMTSSGIGFSGGPGGHPGSSFLQGLTAIVSQIGGFFKQISPQLGGLFRAALPSLAAFVKIGEQFAKAVLPAMSQSLKALNSSGALPILVQAFKLLSQGIAGFIKNLGPGIKSAAIIFKAAMMVVKGTLQLVGFLASWFANAIVKMAEWVRKAVASIPPFFDRMRHAIASIFDAIRGAIASAWNTIWSNTIGRVIRGVNDVRTWFSKIVPQTKAALSSLGSVLYGIGKAAIASLLRGLQSAAGGLLSWARSLGGQIASAIAGAAGGPIGALGGAIGKVASIIGMAGGGIINEPIIGRGLRTGTTYTFGEGGLRERVTPLGAGSGGSSPIVFNIMVNGDTDPDGAALQIIQKIRKYKLRHGGGALGIA